MDSEETPTQCASRSIVVSTASHCINHHNEPPMTMNLLDWDQQLNSINQKLKPLTLAKSVGWEPDLIAPYDSLVRPGRHGTYQQVARRDSTIHLG